MSSTGSVANGTMGQPSPLMDPADQPFSTNLDLYPGFLYSLGAADMCIGDFNGDGVVDGWDLFVFVEDYNRTNCDTGDPCEGDFDDNDIVDYQDLAVFVMDFGKPDCP